MKKTAFRKFKTFALLGAAVGVVALVNAGCKGNDDAPTPTKNSQYMGGGNTAADKIGEERRKARLPHGGAPQ